MNASLRPWTSLRQAVVSIDSQSHWLLFTCLLGASGLSLAFYFLHQPGYNHVANLVASGIYGGLALLVPYRRAYGLLSNLGLLTSMLLMVYITSNTGGINSPTMVWMTILAVPALLLLGRRWALGWFGLILVVILLMFVAVRQGWISGDVNHSQETIVWALLDKVLVILSLMLAVNFYERMHQRQMLEVEQGNADLERTQKALLQAQSHKDEFIASVGHELRTPMNAILGLNGVLQTELADQPDNMQIAEHIRQSTEQLLRLVNDILDFSQLEAGRLTLLERPVHLENTVRQCLGPFEIRAREKGVLLQWRIEPLVPIWVVADAQRLSQILRNLLDNAVKFTSRGQIILRVKALDECVRFEVEDSGRGIPVERQQQVFNRFEHADLQTNRAYGGTGLGLAICERLVYLQQGRIGVRSKLEQGSLFWVELPLAAAAHQGAIDTGWASSDTARALRFLLVDDNPVNLVVAKLLLLKSWPNAQVASAGSAQEALSMLESEVFDVVLMDMVMPDMDGLEATRRLRQHPNPAVSQVVVIGLTANSSSRDRERCLQAGMEEMLAKPMDTQHVKDVINRLLRSHEAAAASDPLQRPAA
jgi:signal transduction histidine kinase/FixJ family two-component response regulator